VTSPWPLIVRVAIGVVGVAMVAAAFVLLPAVGVPILWLGVMGSALLVAAVFEVGRYGARGGASGSADASRFQRTDEVFVDPTTGVKTRVWFDPRSGERRYEPEP
jgi:hypothetical protein